MRRETRAIIIGALVAVLLQVLLAPNIAIFSVVPNFIIVYTLVVSMVMPGDAVLICAFVLGVVCDLLGYGPVGSLSMLLVLASFASSRAHAVFDNGTPLVPLVILVVFALLVDLLYAAFLLGLSTQFSPTDAFLYRALPGALYDSVLGLLIYPLAARLFAGQQPEMNSVTPGRLR